MLQLFNIHLKESNQNTELSIVLPDHDNWLETSDDVFTVCNNDNLTHQQRYLARQNRTYSRFRNKNSDD
jgi:hypothetical protein